MVQKVILSILVALLPLACTNTNQVNTTPTEENNIAEVDSTNKSKSLCFRNENSFDDNSEDKDVIELNIQIVGEQVTGEYNYLPAFKDKKRGSIEGIITENRVEGTYIFSQEGYEQAIPINIILQDESAIVQEEDSEFKENIAKVDC